MFNKTEIKFSISWHQDEIEKARIAAGINDEVLEKILANSDPIKSEIKTVPH
jgi:hypothetical protein